MENVIQEAKTTFELTTYINACYDGTPVKIGTVLERLSGR